MGSAAFGFLRHDNVVQAMRAAGLVFTGKTNTPEFGLPCYTEPDPEVAPPAVASGTTPHRWRIVSGAAVAVAAGWRPSSGSGRRRLGTHPASANGLVGIKPSRGRISNGPLRSVGAWSTGPLARTVADAAALLA